MNFKQFGRTANLFDYQNMASGTTGKYLNDSGEEIASSIWDITGYIPCDGMNFTVASLGGNAPSICLYDDNKTFIAGQAYNSGGGGTKTAITISSETQAKYIRFSYLNDTATSPDDLSAIMLNEGLTVLPYQPYKDWTNIPHYIHNTSTDTITTLPADIYANDTSVTVGLKGQMEQSGTPTPSSPIQPQECGDLETTGEHTGQYKIPILSNSTTTNVYLGEVQSTRKVKKLEFDGTENWVHRSGDPPNEFFLEINTINVVGNLAISTHYINQDSGSFVDLQDGHILVRLASSGDKTYIGLRDSNYPATSQGRDQLKEWLADQYAAGTPVTIWYVLATPETAVVNEPLRKIGDYADTVSAITIPTIVGTNTLSVDTTLQPSEVSVTYHGWHPVVDVHEMNILLAEKPLCSLTVGSISYTDTLNLATGDVSRYIQQYTLNGTENWAAETTPTYTYSIPITAIEDTSGHKSSHFSCKAQTSQLTSGTFGVMNGKLMLKYNSATTVDAFKQWLVQQYTNGTPVKMYIINSTPTTEIITVPTGLTGTVNGKFSQSRTPTPSNPLYPTANEVPMWS